MTLRELWERGEPTLGGWCVIPSPFAAELMGRAGYDWICIDTQHGLIGYDQMLPMLQALSATGTPAFVRVPWNQPSDIMKALDAGAQGVIVPMVSSAEEALRAVGACRFPPRGYRSWGPTRAALQVSGFGPESASSAVVCVVMIETVEAMANLDEILAVPGVDGVYVGPNDLAVAHGLKPDATAAAPEHRRLIETILEACRRHRLIAGIHCAGADTAIRWREAGFRMLNVDNDALFLRGGAAHVLEALRGVKRDAARTGY
ncbi:MAG: 2,4-dihydroxyhept-2-ene-1,7-dioic acid aldolase [Chloroflexi bacterium 13_1_40CM_3_65_12]|nr:MAG: 2,4-dihydroxyhept-2-ene-1,7-dioic acid aldolase [Chloroflexi bacterium 13_1_40CM_65_17]OLC48684.1 MAG: 2,4-dihydroxyhept-2-ene-1,7-dioic acid aldolase [Chloroflexi bacterium 13_1_40CM_4_65_13]OLD22963.1 MAG: 2,4-dihydroxyhept-2-ene-1,7-dioic acid aldolase [Chloroflexi bacterium 13_1_40CM_3_65_12]OLD50988.1 MAG: 2,4-dihydroxyhept-2-ene-1,7-dioic acid aldolase [Actinobacteria bacterium 13_1_40CM_2_65_8]